MNCWQILYLCTSETIFLNYIVCQSLLWIADKFCIFARLKQYNIPYRYTFPCCELLTNFVSLHVWNNNIHYNSNNFMLWIADKFCIFARLKQFAICTQKFWLCCELLTNFVSLHVWNNFLSIPGITELVVNCWQILYLCTSETIYGLMIWNDNWLWIADKFCIFARLKQ